MIFETEKELKVQALSYTGRFSHYFQKLTLACFYVAQVSIASAFGACLNTVRCELAEKVDDKRRRRSRKTGVVSAGKMPELP